MVRVAELHARHDSHVRYVTLKDDKNKLIKKATQDLVLLEGCQ